MMYTDVRLIILATCVNDFFHYQSKNTIDEFLEPVYFREDKVDLARFDISEVRYGIISLPTELGIPYTQYTYLSFASGIKEKHIRFDSDGKAKLFSVNPEDKYITLDLIKQELENYECKKEFFYEFVAGYVNSAIRKNTPLPWTHQEQYRKIYLTKELLTNGQARD